MAEFRPNHANIRALESAAFIGADLLRKAERAKVYGEAIAPVDTGEYKASFRVTTGTRGHKVYARLSNIAPHARFVEWPHRVHNSTRVIAGRHIIGRSIDAIRIT